MNLPAGLAAGTGHDVVIVIAIAVAVEPAPQVGAAHVPVLVVSRVRPGVF